MFTHTWNIAIKPMRIFIGRLLATRLTTLNLVAMIPNTIHVSVFPNAHSNQGNNPAVFATFVPTINDPAPRPCCRYRHWVEKWRIFSEFLADIQEFILLFLILYKYSTTRRCKVNRKQDIKSVKYTFCGRLQTITGVLFKKTYKYICRTLKSL